MNTFETYLTHVLDNISNSKVKDAMNYSLLNGGKRVRPMLLIATLKAYGLDEKIAYPAGAGIEMIHTYSLIHDDLPAMDNDTLRRGKPTCHVAFDEGSAILAGDALLTHAFDFAMKSSDNATVNCKMVKAFVDAAGADGMILGQIKDIQAESEHPKDDTALKEIHLYKTGKLLTLPLICGAYLAGKDEDIPYLEKIGQYIGLSFQMQDDVLDVTSTVEELGKNINSDADNNKTTYVSLLGIDETRKLANEYFEKALQLLNKCDFNPEPLKEVINYLCNRKN